MEAGSGDKIARNFVARGMSCLDSILAVWKGGSEQDASILHRALLDRLFHLRALAGQDNFEEFKAHSFKAMYEARHRLLSDPDPLMKAKLPSSLKELQKSNRKRYQEIVSSKTKWRRPKAENIAKEMGLHFLYTLGYDYGSTHVHPMANDGESDFLRLTSPTQTGPLPDATVVRNSIVAQTVLTQQALNISSLKWRRIAYDFLDHLLSLLRGNVLDYKITFVKIAQSGPEFMLCTSGKSEA